MYPFHFTQEQRINPDGDRDSPFPFFKLPPEIRNNIYEWSSQHPYSPRWTHAPTEDDFLPDDDSLDSFDWDRMARTNSEMMLQPSLFRSCSMTRREGLPFYFRTCTHIFGRHMNGKDDARITSWLRTITEHGFCVGTLHILLTSPLLEDPNQLDFPYPGHDVQDFMQDILSILPQETTLLFSNYFGHLNSHDNERLLYWGSKIHEQRIQLCNTNPEEVEPVMQFSEEIFLDSVDKSDQQTLALTEVRRIQKESTPTWEDIPATLMIFPMKEYGLARASVTKTEP